MKEKETIRRFTVNERALCVTVTQNEVGQFP